MHRIQRYRAYIEILTCKPYKPFTDNAALRKNKFANYEKNVLNMKKNVENRILTNN